MEPAAAAPPHISTLYPRLVIRPFRTFERHIYDRFFKKRSISKRERERERFLLARDVEGSASKQIRGGKLVKARRGSRDRPL